MLLCLKVQIENKPVPTSVNNEGSWKKEIAEWKQVLRQPSSKEKGANVGPGMLAVVPERREIEVYKIIVLY
ncbi:hypothetical protein WUBG_05569 [Wuchereria bancrofti]|uniref:Uncharacterized protein n=1 Tax=Wuchereria bancrofti TaxID=6293 RepID=J9F235_WUCBA|nr:hypothetical protein WUBG_05569 [Wuchereria bancrofti]VDM11937.1 unnamed protein product [Wuchereria bancrofti]